MHEHKVMYVTVFGTTDRLARTNSFLICLLHLCNFFLVRENLDAMVQKYFCYFFLYTVCQVVEQMFVKLSASLSHRKHSMPQLPKTKCSKRSTSKICKICCTLLKASMYCIGITPYKQHLNEKQLPERLGYEIFPSVG